MRRGNPSSDRSCRACGCTDADCSGCIERTGRPCFWVEADLCSACLTRPPPVIPEGQLVRVVGKEFVAGLIMRDDHCVWAAPKLRWARGMGRNALAASFLRKRLSATVLR
jgi:hypothetical protein